MGKSYLVEGARLRCICGSECSSLKVPDGHGYFANNKKKATNKDCIAEYNIPHFGQCALNQEGKTCKGFMKLASKWENAGGFSWSLESLNNLTTLTMDSFLLCKRGGIIIPESSGQGDVQEIDWAAVLKRYAKYILSLLGKPGICLFGGDPINMNTGNFIYENEDLVIQGVSELSFHIFYNSMDEYQKGCLGEGWHHSYEIFIEKKGTELLHLHLGDGSCVAFRKSIGNIYTPLVGNAGLLHQEADGYRYLSKDGSEYLFNDKGHICIIKDGNGNRNTFKHNSKGQLIEVRGANDGILNYYYNKEGNLYRVCDHTGREVRLWYSYRVLQKFVNSMGQTYTYGYNENLRLESVTTPRGIVGVRNVYDSANRVIKQFMPDGGEIELQYDDKGMCTNAKNQNGYITSYVCDERFRNIKTVYGDGEERFKYNDNNQRILYIDKNGNQTKYRYDAKGNLTAIRNALGGTTEYTYNDTNRIVKITFPGGGYIVNNYDKDGNLRERINQCGNVTTTDYNTRNQPVSIIQPDGSRIDIDYDERGNIRKITDAMGNHTMYQYDMLNRVIATIDGNGNRTEFYYNERNDIIKVVNPSGMERSFEYSPSGKVIQITDFDGTTQKMWYDACNRPECYENQEGTRVRFTRDKMGHLVSEKLPNGAEIHFVHDRNGKLVEYEDPMGGKVKFTYDPCGNQTQIEDAEGGKTSYVYDSLNRMIEETDQTGNRTQYEYDADGNLTGIVDAIGNRRSIEYDRAGRKIKETDALGNVTSYAYNSMGKVIQIRDGADRVVSYEYYPGGMLKKIVYPNGRCLNYAYDGNRNIKEKWDERGAHLYYDYNERNLIKAIRNEENQKITYCYDAIGNVTSITDVDGNVTKYEYSPIGKLLSIEDANGNLTRYSYDLMGDLTAVFSPGNEAEREMALEEAIHLNAEQHNLHLTVYSRDVAGRVTSVTDALGHQEHYAYDKAGRLVRKQDKEGNITSYSYKADGQIESMSYDDERSSEYVYGPLGLLKEVRDWLGSTRMDYDEYGRLLKITDHRGRSTAYEWGSMNEQKALIYPDGSRLDYDYDHLLRLKTVKSENEWTEYHYGMQGRIEEKVSSGGLTTSYRYDRAGRVRKLSHRYHDRILERYHYQYNARGDKAEIEKFRWGKPEESGVYRYFYDPVGQMTSVEKDGTAVREYEYDVFHNRTAMIEQTQRIEYVYNAANQLVSMVGEDCYDYKYDKRGNLIEISRNESAEKTYTFDAAGKMSMAKDALVGECSYSYNGMGNRVSSSMELFGDNVKTEYYFDMAKAHHNLLMRERGNNCQKYLWGVCLEGMENDSRDSRVLLDEMGSPIRLLWKNGNTLSCYGYDEFGQDLYGNIGDEQPFGYTGYIIDEIGGMYHAIAREYMPDQGRFNGEDILKGDAKLPITLNGYIYCRNSALNYWDFLGTTEDSSHWWEILLQGSDADRTLKHYLQNDPEVKDLCANVRTNVYIPNGLDISNTYYITPSGHGFADIIDFNNGYADVYELKHEGPFGRIFGSLQMRGYVEAIQNNKSSPYWFFQGVTQGARPGTELNPVFNVTLQSERYPEKQIVYYTDVNFPGMIFWRYEDDTSNPEFATVLAEDKKKLDEMIANLKKWQKVEDNVILAAEIVGAILLLVFVVGNDAVGLVVDDFLIPIVLAELALKFTQLTCDSDTTA